MKDKILFWMDSNLLYFGIAKYLKDKYDAEYFAITDYSEQLEKFFDKQNILNFNKIWSYRENVFLRNKKPDLEYLEKFEKTNNINLWKIAYSERVFYKYNKYHRFDANEILEILEYECKFFEKVLDEIQPNFLIIKMVDYHHGELLSQICKNRGIKILTMSPTRFGNRYMITEEAGLLDEKYEQIYDDSKNKNSKELKNYIREYSSQQIKHGKKFKSSKSVQFKASIRFFVKVCNNKYRKYIFHTGRTRFRVLKNEVQLMINRFFRYNFLNNNAIKEIKKDEKFLYFTLHSEPERALLFPAPYYMNQLNVIQNIAKSIPIGFKLYVKEHPTQRIFGWRDQTWYKEILKLPNVELLHPKISNDDLLEKCSLTISIGGTVGLESAFFNKPSIVFADVIYSNLDSVEKVENFAQLSEKIELLLKSKININDLNKYIQTIENLSFKIELEKIRADMKHRFYYDDFLREVDISESEMKKFLIDYQKEFEFLVDEHIKKITITK